MSYNKVQRIGSNKIYGDLVASVVECVFLNIHPSSLKLINDNLKTNYNIDIENVFDHPEALKSVLGIWYHSSYYDIINNMKRLFGKSINQKPIFEFMQVLEK